MIVVLTHGEAVNRRDSPALSDLPDALAEERGRVPAAQVVGVNQVTMAAGCHARQVSGDG